jgi:NAD(P)-dependent dehydrogenase (short-subunit alcohol dehydrogenase family)
MAGEDPAAQQHIAGLHPVGRKAEPREMAESALFLLSEQSSFVTGAALLADGAVSVKLG